METPIATALITGTAAIVAPTTAVLTKLFVERMQRPREVLCATLHGRVQMFNKCIDLLATASSVVDTTWGPSPPAYTDAEKAALDGYLNARRQAVMRGAEYREIFTHPKLRGDRIAEAMAFARENPKYRPKGMAGFPDNRSIPDFLVADKRHIILSNVHVEPEQRFLYLQCELLAQHFVDWFDDCWHHAKSLEQFSRTLNGASTVADMGGRNVGGDGGDSSSDRVGCA